MTAQLQHSNERFRRSAVRKAGGQFVPPLLKLVQQVRQRLHRVSPLLRSTAPIGRPAISDNHRRLRGTSAAFALRRATQKLGAKIRREASGKGGIAHYHCRFPRKPNNSRAPGTGTKLRV